MTDEEVLHRILRPAMEDAVAVLSAGEPDSSERRRLADTLAGAAEQVQRELGERAREPRLHRIIGRCASAAMALSFAQQGNRPAELSAPRIADRLRDSLEEMSARPWSPEDQGRA